MSLPTHGAKCLSEHLPACHHAAGGREGANLSSVAWVFLTSRSSPSWAGTTAPHAAPEAGGAPLQESRGS